MNKHSEPRDAVFAPPYGPDITRGLLLKLDRFEARSVLDLACGQGWLTAALANCGFEAEGLEPDAARVAAARVAHPQLRFHRADGTPPQLPDGRAYDAAVGVQLRPAAPPTERLLLCARQALRPGGLLLLTVPRQGSFAAANTLSAWLQRLGFEQPRVDALGFVAPLARTLLVTARRPVG